MVELKRWLKKHDVIRHTVTVLGLVFIGMAIRGLVVREVIDVFYLIMHSITLFLWVPFLLWSNGIFDKIYNWWNKD